MNILIRAHHYAVASGRYAYEALRRMGHTVHSEGPSHGNYLPWNGGVYVDADYEWTPDAPPKGWQPDLVLHMDAHLQPQAVEGALHVVYGVDNHVRDYEYIDGRRKTPYPFDHLFLGHGHGNRIGEDNVTWLPCGFDPAWFVPGPEWANRLNDAAMMGVQYAQRAELLGVLLAHLPAMRIAYGLALYPRYVNAYHSAKLSLCQSAARDVAQRVWETAAMGCLVVMDDCHDAADLGLIDGENCLIYGDLNEAAKKVKWALTHQDDAEQIAINGQQWAQSGTWDRRLQVIIEWVEAQKPSGKKAEKA